jgi:hypothetical protein
VLLAGLTTRFSLGNLKTGIHGFSAWNRTLDRPDPDKRWNTAGVYADISLSPQINIYAETNILLREPLSSTITDTPPGFGSYGAVLYTGSDWKQKLEIKDYRNYIFDFHRPPVLEEDIVPTLNFEDVTGGRLTVERKLGSDFRTSVSSSLLVAYDRVVKSSVYHGVLKSKATFAHGYQVEARVGYRQLPLQADLSHGNIKIKIPTFTAQAVELGYRKLFNRSGLNFLSAVEDRNYFDLAYTLSDEWSVNLGAEYLPTNAVDATRWFFNAGTYFKTGAFSARAFVGGTSGGPQCSGGICRQVPPFSGGMVEGTYSF